jgi:hypothetical protein
MAVGDPRRAVYLSGDCTALALALHQAFGHRLGVVMEGEHPVHVFVVDGVGSAERVTSCAPVTFQRIMEG